MREIAKTPNDLEKLFVERANAGDVEGLVALYEPNAILLSDSGQKASGTDEIRQLLVGYLSHQLPLAPSLQAPALQSGDIALTSSRHSNGETSVEIARRQPDGSWLWVVDNFEI